MATGGQAEFEQVEVGRKDLKLITEVAVTTMTSSGVKTAFREYWDKPTAGLFYTLSYCTFPLLEDVMRVVIEVATPEKLPSGLYTARSHDLRWLQRRMGAALDAGGYPNLIADVDRHFRDYKPSYASHTRMRSAHPLLAGHSVFENVITHASKIWPKWKYLEADRRINADRDLIPLAFDATRWLLWEFLRHEEAYGKVAASFPEMEQYMGELLDVA